jgi:hypothetical protein
MSKKDEQLAEQNKAKGQDSFEMTDGQIMVFRNNKKEEKQPDYWGKLMLNGEEKRVALWLKVSNSGSKYMNGTISGYAPNDENVDDEMGI